MTMVYVQNKDGKPLMPTTRYCYVRLLLKEKKARVVCTTPFTIQLNYDTPDVTQDLFLASTPAGRISALLSSRRTASACSPHIWRLATRKCLS